MYRRYLDLSALLKHKSLFLFGPRQTGKSTLLRTRYPDALTIDLLKATEFRDLSARPELLGELISSRKKKLVVIDEIQRLPELLNEVHRLIESDKKLRFVLTGSSARSLKRHGTNLLGGRALSTHLHPLVSWELEFRRFEETLTCGSLPGIVDSAIKKEELKAYVGTYLQEEIRAEGMVRNLPAFNRFLEVSALCSGQQINYAQVGSDAGVKEKTVKDYFQILVDTFLGSYLPSFRKTKTRKGVSTPKFYFFDTGVWNALLGRFEVSPKTKEFGEALEHRIFHELRSYLDYTRSDSSLSYWRPERQSSEVDFLVDARVAVEVKGTGRVDAADTKGIRLLAEEIKLQRKIVVCSEPAPRKTDLGIEIWPYKYFCEALWAGDVL